MSRDVWGVLIYHQWCLGADLEPPVIKIFPEKNIFSRTSGNVLISILALSVRQTDASGTHLGPFSCFYNFFYLGGIIGCPFRHNRLSWRHNRLSWRHRLQWVVLRYGGVKQIIFGLNNSIRRFNNTRTVFYASIRVYYASTTAYYA